jgi:alkylhydroperoxidase family enzyme
LRGEATKTTREDQVDAYLTPIDKPKSLYLRLGFFFVRREFGKVMMSMRVFAARMPTAFMNYYYKMSSLDKKLVLPSQTAVLIREQVASINMCAFCMDASRWYVLTRDPGNLERLDALKQYQTSPLFTEAQRAALDYASELTRDKQVQPATFARLTRYYNEREICDIVWLVASEHLNNLTNIGLGIGSDGFCELAERNGKAAKAAAKADA